VTTKYYKLYYDTLLIIKSVVLTITLKTRDEQLNNITCLCVCIQNINITYNNNDNNLLL